MLLLKAMEGWGGVLSVDNSIAVPYSATDLELNFSQSFPIPLFNDLTSWLLLGPASHRPMPSLVYVERSRPEIPFIMTCIGKFSWCLLDALPV